MRRALVVDPDPATREHLLEKLAASNLQIGVCADGGRALEMIREWPTHLVLCALEMPAPHGPAILKALREMRLSPRFIFLSRLFTHDASVADRVRAIGPHAVLGKPVHMNRLYRAVEAELGVKINWDERRAELRVPVRAMLRMTFRSPVDSTVVVEEPTLDVSPGGLLFERAMCSVCTGYRRGGVHPDCVLRPHSLEASGRPLDIELHIPGGAPLRLRARVVHTLIEEGSARELVGLRFVYSSEEDQRRLRSLLRRHSKGLPA